MRWLFSPVITFLGLLATVITLGQFAVSVCKWAIERMYVQDIRSRIYATVVVAGFATLAIIAPLTWTEIIHVAAKNGQNGFEAPLYPVMIHGMSLCGLLTLYITTAARMRECPWRQGVMLFVGFGGAVVMYFFSSASAWERYLVAVFPGLVITMFALAVLLDAARHGKAESVA